jgi:hypothetical protein
VTEDLVPPLTNDSSRVRRLWACQFAACPALRCRW